MSKYLGDRALIPVPIGEASLFSPAMQYGRTLVIFVHGFRGKALSTWLSFPDFVDEIGDLRKTDMFYYGYASRPQRIQNMAINLRSHMDAVWKAPNILGENIFNVLLERQRHSGDGSQDFWDNVFFVAHSLGAVVVRRAIMDSYIDEAYDGWSGCSKLFLFAPAHSGANILRLIGETLTTVGIPLAPILKGIYPCLIDLDERSIALANLREDYHNLDEFYREHIKASAVILAENDFVVDPSRFPGDPVSGQISGKGHTDLCKPKEGFLDPINKLSKVLSEP